MYTIKDLTTALKQNFEFSNKTHISLLIGVVVLAFLWRLLPIFRGPWFAWSYDFGFYLYQVRHLSAAPLLTYLAGLSGNYSSPLFLLYKLVPIGPENFLLILSLACEAALVFSFVRYFKNQPKLGLVAALLAIFSVVQTETSLLVLIKTLIALPIMVLGLAFIKENRWRKVGVIFILLLVLHRTTAIFFTLTFIMYGLFVQIKLRQWRWLLAEIALVIIGGWFLWNAFPVADFITKIFSEYNPYVRGGIFLANHNWLVWLWPIWLLGLGGIIFYIKHRQHPLPVILALTTAAWIILKLPFYNRALIYLDLALIIFAAYFLNQLNLKKHWHKAVLVISLLVLAGYSFYFLKQERPLISQTEVNEIKNFSTPLPGQFVLTTSANDATWLLGFLKDSRLGAPGLYEDRSTYQEWNNFWNGVNQTQFLWRYPRPLYIYQRDYYVPGPINDCFLPLSPHFFQYVCLN